MKNFITFRRAFLFDPCLGKMTGHWESYCRRFSDELTARGIEVKLFCQQDPEPSIVKGLDVIPNFTTHVYNAMPDLSSFHKECEAFANDFSKIDTSIFTKDDILIFPTIFPQLLKPLMEWLQAFVGSEGPKAAMFFLIPGETQLEHMNSLKAALLNTICNIQWLPDFIKAKALNELSRWPKSSLYGIYYASFADLFINKIPSTGYYYFSACNEFSSNFNRILNIPVKSMPIPTVTANAPSKVDAPENKKKILRIGYFGNSSLEKGAQFLEYIVKGTHDRYPLVQFDLHINPNIHTKEILKKFYEPMPNVNCYHGHIETEQLVDLMHNVDINLLPYAPTKYGAMPSSIFAESVCAANVMVLPNNTWLAREAAKIDTGYVLFKHYDQESIKNALLYAIAHYPSLKQKVYKAREVFLKENNLTNYIDIFLDSLQE